MRLLKFNEMIKSYDGKEYQTVGDVTEFNEVDPSTGIATRKDGQPNKKVDSSYLKSIRPFSDISLYEYNHLLSLVSGNLSDDELSKIDNELNKQGYETRRRDTDVVSVLKSKDKFVILTFSKLNDGSIIVLCRSTIKEGDYTPGSKVRYFALQNKSDYKVSDINRNRKYSLDSFLFSVKTGFKNI